MAEDSHHIDYLFDFIYVDRERIASHFAQLFPEGALTAVKAAYTDADQGHSNVHGSLGVLRADLRNGHASSETLERQYDAAWTLPITLANRLDELGFLHKELAQAPLGQLVLLKGNIQIIDIRMLQNMWDPLAKFMSSQKPKPQGNRKQRRASKGQEPRLGDELEFNDTMAELMRTVPHALQLNFCSDCDNFVWSTLAPDMMTTSADDFALKHGTIVPGEWHMIAVVDRRPDYEKGALSNQAAARFNALANVGPGLTRGLMDLLDNLRGVIGRPAIAYGATPLMIFRALKPSNC